MQRNTTQHTARRVWRHFTLTVPARRGFTLIELSIVLVVIALVTGGILVGKDLLEDSKIRSQAKQLHSIQTMFHTFALKYNCLPGDCNNATTFGIGPNGDGDRRIAENLVSWPVESTNFWFHLENSSLLRLKAGIVNGVTVNSLRQSVYGNNADMFVSLGGLYPGAVPGEYRTRNGISFTNANLLPGAYQYGAFSSAVAYRLDQKLDNGLPRSGIVVSVHGEGGAICYVGTAYVPTDTLPDTCRLIYWLD